MGVKGELVSDGEVVTLLRTGGPWSLGLWGRGRKTPGLPTSQTKKKMAH
jgi:hypothetical protein